ncbi:MAG: rod shape-determining protein RodA [Desulfotalea sp.]
MKFDRRLFLHFDWFFLLFVLTVVGMALCNLYSASTPHTGYGAPAWLKQVQYTVLMSICGFIIICLDYKVIDKLSWLFYWVVVAMLLFVLVSGHSAGGAQRWINLGFMSLQPSELAKVSMVICLAKHFSDHDRVGGYRFRDLIWPALVMGLPFFLIYKQPDLGTALMLIIIFGCMALYINLRKMTYVTLAGLAVGAGVVGYNFFLKDYQRARIATFLEPNIDIRGGGYQLYNSMVAIGSGGWTGKGYGEGPQGHLSFLPERHTDFAFAVLAEEWGFIGSFVFLGVYFLMLAWGLKVAHEARDRFGLLLAYGSVVLIFWQAVINLFMIFGFCPVVGIPLPLVSYGGSSLLATYMCLTMILSVSMRRYQVGSNV